MDSEKSMNYKVYWYESNILSVNNFEFNKILSPMK